MTMNTKALRDEAIAAIRRAIGGPAATDAAMPVRVGICDGELNQIAQFTVSGAEALARVQQELAELGYRSLAIEAVKRHQCDVVLVQAVAPPL